MNAQNRIWIWSPTPTIPQLQNQNVLRLAMRGLTLRRITPYKISHRFIPPRMADAKINQSGSDTSSPEKKDKVIEKMPEPPEKPLPDDCCGSGCVRCVWDVYYDELEAYNKLVAESENRKDSVS